MRCYRRKTQKFFGCLKKQSSGKYNENKIFDYFNHVYLFEKFFNFKSQKIIFFPLFSIMFVVVVFLSYVSCSAFVSMEINNIKPE